MYPTLVQKAEDRDQKVELQRAQAQAQYDGSYDGPKVLVYSPCSDKNGPFIEHFYPWERLYLHTNDFEKFSAPSTKSDNDFQIPPELEKNLSSCTSSSNTEDRPPPSERLFFNSSMDNVLDIVDQNTAYEPVLTRQKQRLLYSLSPFVLASENTFKQNMRIVNRRLELICDHCRELTRKRYAKAHRRLSRVHAKKMDPMDEAQELLRLELLDKKLNAEPNYAPDEPEEYEYRDILLEVRRLAIQQKYHAYANCPAFRRAYRNRVRRNVNRKVTSSDTTLTSSAPTQPNTVRLRAGDGSTPNKSVLFDEDLTKQTDPDIPTSEAELMSDLGASISPKVRARRKRLVKTFHRLLRVEQMRLPLGQAADQLCNIELHDKGLMVPRTNSPQQEAIRKQRVQAIRLKFKRYAQEPAFRQRYLERFRAIRPTMPVSEEEDVMASNSEQRIESINTPEASQGRSIALVITPDYGRHEQVSRSITPVSSRTLRFDLEPLEAEYVTAPLATLYPDDFGRSAPSLLKQDSSSTLVDQQMYDDAYYESPGGGLVHIAVDVHKTMSSQDSRPTTPITQRQTDVDAGQQPEFVVVDGSTYTSEYHKCSLCDNVHKCTVRVDADDSLSKTFTVASNEDDDAMPVFSGTFTDVIRNVSTLDRSPDDRTPIGPASRQVNDTGSPAVGQRTTTGELTPSLAAPLKQSTPIDGANTTQQQQQLGVRHKPRLYSSTYATDDVDTTDDFMDQEFTQVDRLLEDSFRKLDESFQPNNSFDPKALQSGFWADRNAAMDDIFRRPQPNSTLRSPGDETDMFNFSNSLNSKTLDLRGPSASSPVEMPAATLPNELLDSSTRNSSRERGVRSKSPVISQRQANAGRNARQNREVAYADVTSTESSFDDEVPTSEQDEIPGSKDADFLLSDDPNFRRPMSKLKLKLYRELAKSELLHGNIENDHELNADIDQKRLNLARRFHAQRIKQHRKKATVRLLNIVADPKVNLLAPTALEIGMHMPEILDKKLADRTSYYNDREPVKYKRVLEERLKAIASKYKAYYTMPATKQAEILKNMMSSLSEKISLPNDYP